MKLSNLALAVAFLTSPLSAFSQEFPWLKSHEEATAKSVEEKKPIMIYFTTTWCGWCKVMENKTFADGAVRTKANDYVSVKLDAEREGKQLAERYKVSAFPTFVFTDAKGKELGRVEGYVEAVPFNQKVETILSGRTGRNQVEDALAKNPNDGELLCRMGFFYLHDGNLSEAKSILERATKLNYRGADLAALMSQVGYEIGLNDPATAAGFLQKSIAMKDRNTISLSYERLMNLAARGGNLELITTTARAILSERDISPDLFRIAEKVVKGRDQETRLTDPALLIEELRMQMSAKLSEPRDEFYFRNLFLQGAPITYLLRRSGSAGRLVVDVDSFLTTLGVDQLKFHWTFRSESSQVFQDMATITLDYQSTSNLTNGITNTANGKIYLILCKQGNRWYIQSLCLQATSNS